MVVVKSLIIYSWPQKVILRFSCIQKDSLECLGSRWCSDIFLNSCCMLAFRCCWFHGRLQSSHTLFIIVCWTGEPAVVLKQIRLILFQYCLMSFPCRNTNQTWRHNKWGLPTPGSVSGVLDRYKNRKQLRESLSFVPDCVGICNV